MSQRAFFDITQCIILSIRISFLILTISLGEIKENVQINDKSETLQIYTKGIK